MLQIAHKVWAWTRASLDAQDVVLIAGMALLSGGLSEVYAPLFWITPGAALTYLAWPKRPVVAVKAKAQES